MNKFIVGLVITVIIGAVVYGAYTIGRNNVSTNSPTVSVSPTPIIEDKPKSLEERPTAGMVNPSATIAAIEDAFNKYDKTLGVDLGVWMANKVIVTLYATECCGSKTPKEASTQLNDSIKNSQKPWDCTYNTPISKQISEKNPQNFKDMTICISEDRKAIGFHLDDQFLIDKISIVTDYKLITNP